MTARIFQEQRDAGSSGKARAGRWILEFERSRPMMADPLTGWNGTDETQPQVRLTFESADAAKAYCAREGIHFHYIPPAPRRPQMRSYAESFR